MIRPSLWLLSGLLLAALACSEKREEAEWCVENGECPKNGRCGLSSFRGGESGKRCYVRDAEDCRAAKICSTRRRCHFDPALSNDCIEATTTTADSACHRSIECWAFGRCGVREGACAATRSEDCKESSGCLLHGACSLLAEDGFCAAATDDDCSASLECAAFGRCKLEKGHLFGVRRVCGNPAHPKDAYADTRCVTPTICLTEKRCLRADDNSCKTPAELGLAPDRLRVGPRD